MKRILEFVDKHPKLVGLVLGAVLLGSVLAITLPMLGSAINESKISKLETEKQQILKERDEARARDLILQGQITAKDEQITDLSSQIERSNERVSNAHKETVSARTNYDKVRRDPAHFNSSDDAGRVVELSTGLRELYSDPPR